MSQSPIIDGETIAPELRPDVDDDMDVYYALREGRAARRAPLRRVARRHGSAGDGPASLGQRQPGQLAERFLARSPRAVEHRRASVGLRLMPAYRLAPPLKERLHSVRGRERRG